MKEQFRPQALSGGYKDFEKFLAVFESITEEREIHYLADAIFHLLLPAESGVGKRFKGGLTVWALWVIKKLMGAGSADGEAARSMTESTSSFAYGFRLLQTPAHHDTLAPILAQSPREERALYGFNWAGADDREEARYSDLEQNLSMLRWSEWFPALWHAIRTACRIRDILSRMLEDSKGTIPGDFTSRMAELVLRQLLELAALRQTPCPHPALFLTYELMPEAKAWVQWARDAGVRVVHVMHGQRLPTYQVTMATDLVLFSKVDEPWFRERVPADVTLWTIGHPRLEMLRQEVDMPPPWDPQRRPRIAFFSQPAEGDYCQELRMNDWRILAGLKGRAEVRFRMHPRESKQDVLADLQRLGADFIDLSEAGLKEDLAWCDAVASSWSTVSMEAAACGRGIFWTCSTPEKYEAAEELRDAGIGALLTDAEDWHAHLDAWSASGWRAPVVLPEQRLRELGMIGDMDLPWLERLGLEPSNVDFE